MNVKDGMIVLPDLPCENGEPVFCEPWEARAFAMVVALNEAGIFTWAEWAGRFGANLKRDEKNGGCKSYYEIWWLTLEEIGEEFDLVRKAERLERRVKWEEAALRTPHGKPIFL